jgi:hypothetical protein
MIATSTHKCQLVLIGALLGLVLLACVGFAPESELQQTGDKQAWRSLFDGKTLTNWKSTNFGGEGEIRVENGKILLETGVTLTGITWTGGDIPRMNYEVSLEAMKVSGDDFFCGLTFPVGDSLCSLIVGGWGGTVVGLSSIDDQDASENETTTSMDFAHGRWYRIRVRVTPKKIEAWIDDKTVIDAVTTGHKISIRPEVSLSKPLGIATWKTEAALRDIKLRKLD